MSDASRECSICREKKLEKSYYSVHYASCKSCYGRTIRVVKKEENALPRQVRATNLADAILRNAWKRAKLRGLPFNIKVADIDIPERCPVLGIPLYRNLGGKTYTSNSPSLDRIVPALGYVKGNVIVVSMLANQIKCHATPDQVLLVGKFYKELEKNSLDAPPPTR